VSAGSLSSGIISTAAAVGAEITVDMGAAFTNTFQGREGIRSHREVIFLERGILGVALLHEIDSLLIYGDDPKNTPVRKEASHQEMKESQMQRVGQRGSMKFIDSFICFSAIRPM